MKACQICGLRKGEYSVQIIRLVDGKPEKKIIMICNICNSIIFKKEE